MLDHTVPPLLLGVTTVLIMGVLTVSAQVNSSNAATAAAE